MKFKVVVIITLIIIALLFAIRPATAQGGECNACDSEHCIKLDLGGTSVSWSLPAASSSYIVKITVKAGSDSQEGGSCHTLTADNPSDGCYLASGFGTKTGAVQKIGAGPACKDISHVLFYWWADHLDTPTPSPTNTPEPTPTATIPPPTSTPGPSPTPTNTPNPRWTPTPTIPVPTLTTPTLPSPTPPADTPTPPPKRKQGFIKGYILCEGKDGGLYVSGHKLEIKTDNIGTLGGYGWPPDGFVGIWPTMPKVGTTVLDAGPGACYRIGDDYPADPTRYDLDAQPKFGVDDVGESGVLCITKCVDSSTFVLPESGGQFSLWFARSVLHYLDVSWRLPSVSISK